MKRNDTLPGLEFGCESRSVYGNEQLIYVGDMGRFPNAVLVGMRRELERLEFGGIAAFAHGKLLYTSQGIIQIAASGQASSAALNPNYHFDYQARLASYSMSTQSDYSYNRAYANQYLQEQFYE